VNPKVELPELWLDAHLSRKVARWLSDEYGVVARHVSDLGLREAEDDVIFSEARRQNVVLVTKDADFLALIARLGPPPRIVFLNIENTNNSRLRRLLSASIARIQTALLAGESVIELQER
jgi:predicted nuclease of predicted toxin-antitoxin system